MPALDDVLQQKLQLLAAKHQLRAPRATGRDEGVAVWREGKRLISFSCNDYLGLSRHPQVIAAARAALEKYGAGAGASRLVTGDHSFYTELESLLAENKHTQAACVFGSGYLANLGTIPALVGSGDLIVADKFIHACMLDAARLSGATLMRFAHNSLPHCRLLLEANRREHHHCLILSETVFSMDGDRAPLPELAALAQEFDSWLMVDGAHDVFSPATHHSPPVTIQMGTLSKAAGSYGGYVCGSQTLIDYLKTAARSLIYSTGLPPASVAASIAAINIMQAQPELCAMPLAHARYFTSLLGMPQAQSAIVPLIVRDSDKALAASKILEENGFLVAAIRPPTVPENTARLRFAFSALHEKSQIEAVAKIIKEQGWLCAPSP
jgi:8-amino-7-oxononanoate synthase